MADLTKNTAWTGSIDLGTITTADASKTITLSTAGSYVDRDIAITVTANAPSAATLGASGSASASIDSVSVGTKADGAYPITGSKAISGTASASTATSGYATKDTTTATGAVSGTAELSATLTAAAVTVAAGGNAASPTVAIDATNDNVLAGTITTTKPTTGYYAAVKATAPKTTLTITKTVNTAGWIGSNTEITATATTTAKTGSTYYVPLTAGSFSTSTLSVKTSTNGLKDYVENTSVAIPSEGSLLIAEGYYPKTFISLDQLLNGRDEDKQIAATGTLDSLRTGSVAWTEDGQKVSGAMVDAVITGGAITHTLNAPVYNSTTGVFDQDCSISTEAPTVGTAGYISADDGTKNASTAVTENHTLAKIAGSVAISGTKTVQPAISRSSFTITNVTDAASGAATTTAPTTGVYVKVSTAAKTTNVTAAATISTSGYGTKDNHGITGSGNVAVGASASAATYVPIKTTSAANKTNPVASASSTDITLGTVTTTKPTSGYYIQADATKGVTTVANAGWITAGDTSTSAATTRYYPVAKGAASVSITNVSGSTPTLNTTSNKYDVALSGSATSGTVGTAGYLKTTDTAQVTGSASGTYTMNAAALTHANTATETKVAVSASGTRSSNLAAPGSDTTYYVTVNASQTSAGSVKHSASVSEGYVPTAGLSQEATIATSASITGNGGKVYLKSTAITGSVSGTMNGTGYNAFSTVTSTTGLTAYVDLAGNGSATSGAVYNGTATAAHKYLKVFDGTYSIA